MSFQLSTEISKFDNPLNAMINEDMENIQEEFLEIDELSETFIFGDLISLQENVRTMNTTLLNECEIFKNSMNNSNGSIVSNENLFSKIKGIINNFNRYFKNICILWLNEYSFIQKPNTLQLAYVIDRPQKLEKGLYFTLKPQYTNRKQVSSMLINPPLRENEFSQKRMGAFAYSFILDKNVEAEFNQYLITMNVSSEDRVKTEDEDVYIELNLIAELMLKLIFENYEFPSNLLFSNLPFPEIDDLYYFPGCAVNMATTEIYKFASQEDFETYKERILQDPSIYGILSLLGKPQNKIFKFMEYGEIPSLKPTIESILELKKIQKFIGNAYYPSMLCRKLYEVLKEAPIQNVNDFDFDKVDYALSTKYVDEVNAKITNGTFTLEDFLSIYVDGIYCLFTSPAGQPTMDSMLVKLIYELNQTENIFCVQCGGGAFKIVGNIGKKNDCDSRIYVYEDSLGGTELYNQTVDAIKVEFMKLIYYLENNGYYTSTFLLSLENYSIEIKKKALRFREHTGKSGFPAHLLSIDVVSIVTIRKNTDNTIVCSFEHYSAVFDIVMKKVQNEDDFVYVCDYRMNVHFDENMVRGGGPGQSIFQIPNETMKEESGEENDEDDSEKEIYIMNLLALLKTILETFENKLNLYNRVLQGKIEKDIERIRETLLLFHNVDNTIVTSVTQSLNDLDSYIKNNKQILVQNMLNNDSVFDNLVIDVTTKLNVFIENCESNNNRGPTTLNPNYVQIGNYETDKIIDEIKTFFVETEIKGVFYSTYNSGSPNDQEVKKTEKQKEKKIEKKVEDFIERGTQKRKGIVGKLRGLFQTQSRKKNEKNQGKSSSKKNRITLPKKEKVIEKRKSQSKKKGNK
jgi:hypothetical protein